MPSKPIINETFSGYSFDWEDKGLQILVSYLHLHQDGRITGELLLKNLKTGNPLYPPTDFNFKSESTRTRLINTLGKIDSSYPWADIINQLSLAIIDLARHGEDVQELWTSKDVPPLEFLLEPVIIKGVPNIIFGEKGVTKSMLALIFYICLILPWDDNPLGLVTPQRSVPTLILDYELPCYIAQRNARQIQEGMGLSPFPLYHRHCFLPLAQEIEQVANIMANLKIQCVIIDSLARATGGELNKTEPANAFFEALDKLKTTSLILAPTSKDIESKRKTIYGNALFTYYARNIWELCKTEPISETDVDVALFHKESNLTRHFPNMSFHFCFNGHKTTIERQPFNISEFMEKVSLKNAILSELKRGALSAKEIAEASGGSENSIKVTLNRLQKLGKVYKVSGNSWGLVAKLTDS